MTAADLFEAHRAHLFAVAYRMLGGVADAEDAVQEAFVRWMQAAPDAVHDPRAFLTSVVTRLCIDQLRSARVQRETYVGPWLPEPLPTDGLTPEEEAEQADTLSVAFLLLLETLSPPERAVFLLHEVFGYTFAEIAPVVGKSEANCRQLASRARRHVAAGRPRFEASRADGEAVMHAFVEACRAGDAGRIVALVADDAVLVSDGGGRVAAALRPIYGAGRIARFFLGVAAKAPPGIRYHYTRINGMPALMAEVAGQPNSVLVFEVEADRIRRIYALRNPEKLAHLA